MRWFALALVVVLGGCTTPPPQPASSRPTAIPSSGRTASEPPQASPPPGDTPVAAVPFACGLPVSTPDGQGAFISFPSGGVAADPRGKNGLFYDRAYSRWLPVARNAVSVDGARYAYVEAGFLHVMDVASGQDTRFQLDSPTGYGVLDFAVEGVYLQRSGVAGVWLLDTSGGGIRKVADQAGIEFGGGDREFWLAQEGRVDRIDLSDGYRETWFSRPGAAVHLIGLDQADHPIVVALDGAASELVLLLAPDSRRSLYKGPDQLLSSLRSPSGDIHGIWFGSRQGIYLFTSNEGFQKVSNQPGDPAGLCV